MFCIPLIVQTLLAGSLRKGSIVVVPGLWVPYSPEKVSEECSWLKLLVASTDNDTRVFIFKYEIEPNETGSVWHQLLGLSKVLLDNLRQIRPFEVGTLGPEHDGPTDNWFRARNGHFTS